MEALSKEVDATEAQGAEEHTHPKVQAGEHELLGSSAGGTSVRKKGSKWAKKKKKAKWTPMVSANQTGMCPIPVINLDMRRMLYLAFDCVLIPRPLTFNLNNLYVPLFVYSEYHLACYPPSPPPCHWTFAQTWPQGYTQYLSKFL